MPPAAGPTRCDVGSELIRQLDQVSQLSGVRDVLRVLVEHFAAFGVILWEVAQGVEQVESRRLFVQGQYFIDRPSPPFFELPMDSISGQAVLLGQPTNHARSDGRWTVRVHYPEALDRYRIISFVTVPIQLRGGGRNSFDSALTFYRTSGPFSDQEFTEIRRAAVLFPSIYRAVLDKVSLNLFSRVQEILRHAHYPRNHSHVDSLAKQTLQRVAEVVKQNFRSMETVIYLRDPSADPDPEKFTLMAQVWSWSKPPRVDYTFDEGGTGWVLKHGKPLQILDMRRYDCDLSYYRRHYPGMVWIDRIGIEEEARTALQLGPNDDLPPLSYVAVPALHENEVVGALRCCIPRDGPYCFDDDLTHALCSVADLVADWWVHWIEDRHQASHNTTLLKLLAALSQTNREALLHLGRPETDFGKIIDLALRACKSLAPEVDVIRVWMKDEPLESLRLAGQLWTSEHFSQNVPQPILLSEKSVTNRQNGLLAAYDLRETVLVLNIANSPYFLSDCSECRSFVAAPIVIEEAPHGVLAMLILKSSPPHPSIATVAKFVAQQLALYETLRLQLSSLEEAHRMQGDLLLDFQHQVRSPVLMAHTHAEMLLSEPVPKEILRPLEIIREASAKASSVASNLRLFVQLAQKHPPLARLVAIKPSVVFRKLQHANLYSHKALGKRLEFVIDPSVRTEMRPFYADIDRLDLVFDNLLDNAVKYSFPNTSVRVLGGVSRHGREVFIAFQNEGLKITPEEAGRLAMRSYRGREAVLAHPEGTGIGLWLAQRLLHSMEGHLQVLHTNTNGINEVRIYLKRV